MSFRWTTTCRYALAALGLLFLTDCRLFDHCPDVPAAPVGPEYGLPDSSYSFATAAYDPDGDSVQLQVSWGDSSKSDWSGRISGGAKAIWARYWHSPRSYEVRVRARDTHGAVSDWSPALSVQIISPDSLPLAPSTPVGPDSARVGFINEFTCVLRGPPGESLGLGFDWGVGEVGYPWDASGLSGETLGVQGAFWSPGVHLVRAQVLDIHRRIASGWSGQLKTTVASSSGSGWERRYGEGGDYPATNSVAPTADGGLVITGESDSGLFLVTTDAAGNLRWRTVYDTVCPVGMSVRQTADGGYIIASTGWGPWFPSGLDLVRTDESGGLLWHKVFWGGSGGEDPGMYARSVRPCADGGYIIAASTLLMKTDSLGDTVWTRSLSAEDVELMPDGGYVICGDSDGPSLTRTDNLGNMLWKRVYGGFPYGALAVAVTSDGGYVITGYVWSETCEDSVYLAKATSDGSLVWKRTCYGLRGTDGLDICVSADGGYYVAGVTEELDSPYLARFDADGKVKWQRMLSFACGRASSVLPTPDNGCIVAGSDDGYAVLFKVDKNGGMGPEFRGSAPRPGTRAGHDLARMHSRRPGLRNE